MAKYFNSASKFVQPWVWLRPTRPIRIQVSCTVMPRRSVIVLL
jgi:hypothetical protein